MKLGLYLLLVGSIGLNLGLLIAKLTDHGPDRRSPGPPPVERRRPENVDPADMVAQHIRGMSEHVGLSPDQQAAIRDVLTRTMPALAAERDRSAQLNRELSRAFAALEFEPDRFTTLGLEAARSRARIDSLSAVMLLGEAAVLTPEQRRIYAAVAPTIHSDPRRSPPPGAPPPERRP